MKKSKKAGFLKTVLLAAGLGLESMLGCGNSPTMPVYEPAPVSQSSDSKSEEIKQDFLAQLTPSQKARAQPYLEQIIPLRSSSEEIKQAFLAQLKPEDREQAKAYLAQINPLRSSKLADPYYWVESAEDWNKSPDFNNDRLIDFSDFVLFAKNFNGSNNRYDLTGDGKVFFEDFIRFANNYGKRVNSGLVSKPVSARKIPQLEAMARFSNPDSAYSVDLSQIVENKVFPEDPIKYGINKTTGLVSRIEGTKVFIRPKGTFNSTDNGLANLEYTAEKEGARLTGKVEIDISRNEEFMNEINTVLLINQGLVIPLTKAYLWTGNIMKDGDPRDPRKWSGPLTSKEDIAKARKAISQLPILTHGYIPSIEIQEGTDYTKLYDENKNELRALIGWINWTSRSSELVPGNGASWVDPTWQASNSGGYFTIPGAKQACHLHECYHIATSGGESSKKGTETIFSGGTLSERDTYFEMDLLLTKAYFEERANRGLIRK